MDHADTDRLDELTYLLESGSDRAGALDVQRSPTEYEPREARNAALEELLEAASLVEQGVPLTEELQTALNHGTAIGGARPKALIGAERKGPALNPSMSLAIKLGCQAAYNAPSLRSC